MPVPVVLVVMAAAANTPAGLPCIPCSWCKCCGSCLLVVQQADYPLLLHLLVRQLLCADIVLLAQLKAGLRYFWLLLGGRCRIHKLHAAAAWPSFIQVWVQHTAGLAGCQSTTTYSTTHSADSSAPKARRCGPAAAGASSSTTSGLQVQFPCSRHCLAPPGCIDGCCC